MSATKRRPQAEGRRYSETIGVPPQAVEQWLALVAAAATFRPSCTFSDEWTETPAGDIRKRAELTMACARCHIRRECDAYGEAADETSGCWGGIWRDQIATERKRLQDRAAYARKTKKESAA